MSENQLIGIIYSQLMEEFGFDYEKDLWMIAENIAGKIVSQPAQLNDNQKIVLEWLKWSVKDQRHSTIDAVFLLKSGEALDSVLLALMELNDPQQAEVLAAFAQWALEEEEA